MTIPPMAVVGWRGLPPPRRPGLDPPAVRGRTARLEASVRHAMGRQQDGLFAPRHVAPDRRRPYRKTKTFWEAQMRASRLPGKSAACVIAALVIALSAATPVVAQKRGGTLRLYHNDNPPSTSLLEESTIASVTPFSAV